jgi:hypothetical protein
MYTGVCSIVWRSQKVYWSRRCREIWSWYLCNKIRLWRLLIATRWSTSLILWCNSMCRTTLSLKPHQNNGLYQKNSLLIRVISFVSLIYSMSEDKSLCELDIRCSLRCRIIFVLWVWPGSQLLRRYGLVFTVLLWMLLIQCAIVLGGGNGSGTLLFDRDLHICCYLGALYNGREDQWRYWDCDTLVRVIGEWEWFRYISDSNLCSFDLEVIDYHLSVCNWGYHTKLISITVNM